MNGRRRWLYRRLYGSITLGDVAAVLLICGAVFTALYVVTLVIFAVATAVAR